MRVTVLYFKYWDTRYGVSVTGALHGRAIKEKEVL